GKMYGRGTSDMKSGAAAMTMAIRAIQACGIRLKGDLIVEYVMDEELTGNGTLACVMKGYKADAGICCETSSMCVQPGSIGRIWFTINVKGKAAGIQKHREGVSGIDLGYLVCKAVEEYEALRMSKISHPLYPDIPSSIPCAIGQFDSGTYNSAFPDSCVLKGSMATVPGEDSKTVKADFVRFITERVSAQNPWFKDYPPEVIFTGYFAEPSEIPVESPIVQELIGQFKDQMGRAPTISGRQGAADIRHMNMYGDTPTVIFGPGSTEQMHANNEWVRVQDYLDSIRILAGTILDWCGVAE
ncbi:M20/M25/M40 family metallo-hydrolase, partial [Mitsuokella jalaludinii]|uniref:M20/M25/M40 family metallo-hydrolase n=1 Tax=Mitsuokella jalaludinii TaxID=187979 RepID=UPI002FD953F1